LTRRLTLVVFALAALLLAAFAVLLFSALALAERRLVPWARRRPEGPAR
jgi:ABC-type nitrate/sulfonate/bicarbonate transport system permease component